MIATRATSLLCLFASTTLLVAQRPTDDERQAVTVGDRAPELHASLVDDPDRRVTLAGLRGKVVVLEFWTTWCGSCLAAAPHWNEVVAEVSREAPDQFAFVAISNEDAALVQRCLQRVPRGGQVVVDDEDRTFAAYDPGAVPHVVIVGRDGRIAAITDAAALNIGDLRAIAAGEPHALPVKSPPERRRDLPGGPVTARRTVIEKTEAPGRRSMLGRGRFVAEGLPLALTLRSVFELPQSQLVIDHPQADELHDVTIEAPGVPISQMREYARAELVRALGLRVRQRSEQQDVFVLRRVDGAEPLAPSTAEAPKRNLRGTNLSCRKQPLQPLLDLLSRTAGGRVFVDETGLEGYFDYDLVFFDKEGLVDGLRELGLEYTKERRDVEVTVLEPADAGK